MFSHDVAHSVILKMKQYQNLIRFYFVNIIENFARLNPPFKGGFVRAKFSAKFFAKVAHHTIYCNKFS